VVTSFPITIALLPVMQKQQSQIQSNTENLMNYAKNHTFDQFHHALSNATLSREPGSKVEYSTFGIGLLGIILKLKSNMSLLINY
jgi:hypothetical protein